MIPLEKVRALFPTEDLQAELAQSEALLSSMCLGKNHLGFVLAIVIFWKRYERFDEPIRHFIPLDQRVAYLNIANHIVRNHL